MMFIVILRFLDKSRAPQVMEAHNIWVKRGFDDGIFLAAGPMQPANGGVILAHDVARADLEKYVADDPFVSEAVVDAEILEFSLALTHEQLAFLKAEQGS